MVGSDAALDYIQSVVYGRRRGPTASAVLVALRGLSAVYRLALRLYLLTFDLGIRRRKRLPCPAVSVGNLTMGGTGKTPVTRYICEGLRQRGWKPTALSYGYGGSLGGRFGVVSDAEQLLLTPEQAGDEPAMLALQLPRIPVVVDKDRFRSGRYAVAQLGANIAVLDDGFQVWKLHRDLDIVLVDSNGPFDNWWTLPAGRLREPISALRRARSVVLMGARPEEKVCAELDAKIRQLAPQASIFCGTYMPHSLYTIGDGSQVDLETIRGHKVFALSSIAKPESFEQTLRETGAVIVGGEHFPDHYVYAAADLSRVEENAQASGARFVVTTEKDAVKLKNARAKLPMLVLGIKLLLDEESRFWQVIDGALAAYDAIRSDGRNV